MIHKSMYLKVSLVKLFLNRPGKLISTLHTSFVVRSSDQFY